MNNRKWYRSQSSPSSQIFFIATPITYTYYYVFTRLRCETKIGSEQTEEVQCIWQLELESPPQVHGASSGPESGTGTGTAQ